jgi:hypothetical protein
MRYEQNRNICRHGPCCHPECVFPKNRGQEGDSIYLPLWKWRSSGHRIDVEISIIEQSKVYLPAHVRNVGLV